jgi:UDP-N-acetylmuramoyl-tripeptide--D-alanyl-D-alanine ligase
MIDLTLKQIAEITNGTLRGDANCRIDGIEIDSRQIRPGMMFAPLAGERVNGHDFVPGLLAQGIPASFWQQDQPGMPEDGNLVIVADVKAALTALAKAWRRMVPARIIGVTGSAGKTSTKDLIAAVLSIRYRVCKTAGNRNNDIGVPRTILSIGRGDDFAVVEMGISDWGEMDQLVDIVDPEVTVITAIAEAHIQNFHTLDNIVAQKCRINQHLGPGQCFYNADAYGLTEAIAAQPLARPAIGYGYDHGTLRITGWQALADGMHFTTTAYDGRMFVLPLLGKHLIANAAAAVAIGQWAGLSGDEVQQGFSGVELTPHRMQPVNVGNTLIIDDTYNSNPASLKAALEFLSSYEGEGEKIAVIGDMLELGEASGQLHAGIARQVDFAAFDRVFLYGENMRRLFDELVKQGRSAEYFTSFDDLKASCRLLAGRRAVVLLKASNGLHFIELAEAMEDTI